MDTEIPPLTHLKSGETANSSIQQNGRVPCQSSISSLSEKHENLMSEDFEQCEASHIPFRDAGDDVNGAVQPDIISGKSRHQKEMTFQDMYNGVDYDDSDEDEDSDWEPSQEDSKSWFCTNCTMANLDDVLHCDICGEYKDSTIVTHGFFVSHASREVNNINVKSDVRDRYEGSCSWTSASINCTAVGFDERMLLHSEVVPYLEGLTDLESKGPKSNTMATVSHKKFKATMATVSMFLACKVEETPRSLKDVVVVGYEMMFKRDPLAGQRIKNKDVYEKQKELVLIGERVLLATVGFDLNIQHPYKSLVTALKRLDISQKDLTKVAWNFVNDWLRTTLCLEYKPHYVAAGSMYLAAKFFKVKLPSEKGKAWWMEFDVTPQRLEEVVQQMVKLLEQSKSPLLFSSREKVKQTTVEKKAESSSPQSCVLSRSNTTSEKAGDGRSQNISQSVQCVANDDICVARKEEEIPQCQTSDCGSAESVVEDGNRSDEGEAQPQVVVEPNQTARSKVASDSGLLNKIDKERIKEALKKRRNDKLANKKVATATTHDDGDPESWIVRELEEGIDMQYASAEKKQKL